MVLHQRYKKYKSTRCGWLSEIPEHWGFTRIKNVATHNDEALDERTDPDLEIDYVDISSVTLTKGIEKTETMLFEKAPSRARRKVKDGDIIVSTVRTYLKAIAPIYQPQENMVVSTGFAVIRPKGNFLSGFAGYLLQSNGFVGEVVANSVGVSYPAINASDLVHIPAVEPPLEEQQTIARFLDFKTAQIDALIVKKKALLDKLAEKRTALISHAVTKGLDVSVPMKDSGVAWLGEVPAHWVVKRARYASIFVTSGSRGWAEYYSEIGSVFLRITNVSRNSVDLLLHDIQRVLPPESSEGERTATQAGDVIVSITADLGSVAVVPEAFENAYVSQHLALIRPERDQISGLWMAYQFFSTSGQAQLTGSGYGGSKIQLGLGDVKDVWIVVPSKAEQETISAWLGEKLIQLKRQTYAIQEVIKRLQEYRSALITNAVTGKIDVRGFEVPTSTQTQELAHE